MWEQLYRFGNYHFGLRFDSGVWDCAHRARASLLPASRSQLARGQAVPTICPPCVYRSLFSLSLGTYGCISEIT